VYNISTGNWDDELLAGLGLEKSYFVPVKRSGTTLGGITPAASQATGLRAGLPVCLGIGDNQESYLGSVADRDRSVLVNVGTGGQVSVYRPRFTFHPQLETRPFPRDGYLLVSAGLCGGRSYALVEQFFRAVGSELFGVQGAPSVYAAMNRLASAAPNGT